MAPPAEHAELAPVLSAREVERPEGLLYRALWGVKVETWYQVKAAIKYHNHPDITIPEIARLWVTLAAAGGGLFALWGVLHAVLPILLASPIEEMIAVMLLFKVFQRFNIRCAEKIGPLPAGDEDTGDPVME